MRLAAVCLGEPVAAGNDARQEFATFRSPCAATPVAYLLAAGAPAFCLGSLFDGWESSLMKSHFFFALLAACSFAAGSALADNDDPDLIFRKSTTFKFFTPNDKLATYGVDDPVVDGVACYFTVPEKGGVAGALGLAEQTSDVSLACRQYGPIKIKDKFDQGDVVFRERRSLFFKKMQIVRGCDAKRNVLIYMVYTDKLIEGSPKNSTSSVPIQPWGASADAPKCGDFAR
jgi:CreA protein